MQISHRYKLAGAILTASAVSWVLLAPSALGAWTAPATISEPHMFIGGLYGQNVLFASGPAGTLATWTYEAGLGTRASAGVREAVARPGKPFGVEQRLPASYLTGSMVNIGGGRVAQLILKPRGPNTSSMSVAIGSVDGRFGRPIPVPGSVFAGRASLAGNTLGDLLVSWIAAGAHGEHRSVWASVRIVRGGFSAPQRLSSNGRPEQVRAAIGRSRRMVVAFDSGSGALLARVREGRRAWGRTARLGPAAVGTENDVTPFVGDFGEVVVAWYHTQLCEGGCESPGYIEVAVQPASLKRFVKARRLERDPIGLAAAPSGRSLAPVVIAVPWSTPTIAFLAAESARTGVPSARTAVVKVAYPTGAGYGPRGGGYTTSQALSPANEQAGDLAGAAGRVGELLTWIREEAPDYVEGVLFAAAIGKGLPSRFGAPEQATSGERVLSAYPVFNTTTHWPAGGGVMPPWTLAWTSRIRTEAPVEAVVRASSPICTPTAATPLPDPICF